MGERNKSVGEFSSSVLKFGLEAVPARRVWRYRGDGWSAGQRLSPASAQQGSAPGAVCVCVYVHVHGVYLRVCTCVQEGTGMEREERHRKAQRAAGMSVSRREKAGEAWSGLRRKSCCFL